MATQEKEKRSFRSVILHVVLYPSITILCSGLLSSRRSKKNGQAKDVESMDRTDKENKENKENKEFRCRL
jgi:hypothetical protein